MSDDKSLRTPADAQRVNVGEDYEVRYWTNKWNVTPVQLRAAVDKASGDPEDAGRREPDLGALEVAQFVGLAVAQRVHEEGGAPVLHRHIGEGEDEPARAERIRDRRGEHEASAHQQEHHEAGGRGAEEGSRARAADDRRHRGVRRR